MVLRDKNQYYSVKSDNYYENQEEKMSLLWPELVGADVMSEIISSFSDSFCRSN